MNNIERNRALIEQEGFDYSNYAKELSKKLKNSSLYLSSLSNLETASSCNRPNIVKSYQELRDLSFLVNNLTEYLNLENKVLYLAIKSSPKWWINPFDYSSIKYNISLVGDLFTADDGKYTFNDLIQTDRVSSFEKKIIVQKRVETYKNDMIDKTILLLNKYKANVTSNRPINISNFLHIIQFIYILFLNLLLIFLFAVPSYTFAYSFYHPSYDSIQTWIIYMSALIVPFVDFFYILNILIRIRRDEYSSYVREFNRLKKVKYIERLNHFSYELTNELFTCIDNKTNCNTSIDYYSSQLNKLLNFNELEKHKINNRMIYSIINALSFFMIGISILIVIFDIICIIILAGR